MKTPNGKLDEWIDHMSGDKISPRLAKKGIGLGRQISYIKKQRQPTLLNLVKLIIRAIWRTRT